MIEDTTKECLLKLSDGTEIKCTLNGNNYITVDDVSNVDFSNRNFKEIYIDDEKLENQICTNVFTQNDGTHIIFREITLSEKKEEELNEAINDLIAYILGGNE